MLKSIELDGPQITAMKNLSRGKILAGDVGSGKSRTALAWAYIRECGGTVYWEGVSKWTPPRRVKDIYIFTTAKKRDSLEWDREAFDFGIGRDRTLSPSGIALTVDSYNNLDKYTDLSDSIVIFDEQRLVGNGAWVKAFYKIAAQNDWILLSATPGDVWLDYIPVFVANGFYKNRSEFMRRHVVYSHFSKFPKVDHYVEEGVLRRLRRDLLVELPHKRHTNRIKKFVNCTFDEELYKKAWKDRWNPYTDLPIKDAAELFSVVRKVVNSDSSRLEAILELLAAHGKLIVFYNFNYELEGLRSLISRLPPSVEIAEWNGQKHQELPKSESWLYLVQYIAGAEAWECTETNAMAFYSLTYSHRIFEQAQGRIDRRNTPFTDLYYYILKSQSMIDKSIWATLTKKKNFSESAFARRMGVVFDPQDTELRALRE